VHFTVPANPNEGLLVPPFGELLPTAIANRTRLDETDAAIGGVPLARLRDGLRRRVLALAGCDPDDDRPLIVSGHQPGLDHPGILFKRAVLEQLAPAAVCVNVVVDSDTAELLTARVPARRGDHVSVEEIPLARTERRVVLARAPRPDRRAFEDALSRARRAAATLGSDEVLEALDRFVAIHREEYPRHDSLAALIAAYRARYFPTPHVRDVFLTSLCETDEFRTVAAALIEETEGVLAAHNAALARYRRERRIRTTINPFPDLRRDGTAVEAPLWHIGDDGRRSPLFIELADGRTALRAYRTPLGAFTTRPELDALLADVPLRPKAATLTMFLRLCRGDLFIHGVSGGNYDRITDAIIRDRFGIEPPAYAVASLSLRLPLVFDDDLDRRVRRLADRARRMTWNPDEFVAPLNELRREKARILAGAGEHLTRPEHERIESVRRRLLARIAGPRQANDAELAAARAALAAQRRLGARDFPYFLYPLPVLQAAMHAPETTHTG